MLNHCMAHFHKMRSRMKEDFKNVVLLNAYVTHLCSDNSWVNFSGLQFTSTSEASSWLWGEVAWIWDKVIVQAQCSVMFFFEDWYGSSFRAGSVLHKFEGSSEDQKFGSGTATGPCREAVWCWCSAGSFGPCWAQFTFMVSHTGVYHSVMPSSARLIGISFYQFSFTTNAEKLIVFQAMHFISFRYIYISSSDWRLYFEEVKKL